jgi:septation ring formation regulator EzrA
MLTVVLHVYDVALLSTLLVDSNTDDKEDVFSRRVDDEVEKVKHITYCILKV